MYAHIVTLVKYCAEFKDVVQSMFFIVVGTITILTYLKAKHTLLQPIRTEVFKEQIKALSDVLRFFIGKRECALRADFALMDTLGVNACYLLDTYFEIFFNIEFNRNERPYARTHCPSAIVQAEFLSPYEAFPDEPPEPEKAPADPRTKAALWAKYKHGIISLPAAYTERTEEFQRICDSPMLPQQCTILLDEYRELVMKNIRLVGELLTECAQELPTIYPNKESLAKASTVWIENRFVKKLVDLEPKAHEVISFARSYFGVDGLLRGMKNTAPRRPAAEPLRPSPAGAQ